MVYLSEQEPFMTFREIAVIFLLYYIFFSIYNKLSTISINGLHPTILCTKFSLTFMYENPRPLAHKSIVTSVVVGQGQRLTSYSKKTHENLTNYIPIIQKIAKKHLDNIYFLKISSIQFKLSPLHCTVFCFGFFVLRSILCQFPNGSNKMLCIFYDLQITARSMLSVN